MTDVIQVERLTRRYGDLVAVDDVSFRIARGEVVGLLGHNGAGKTTVMKMLTGYLEPTAGNIRIDGLEMAGATEDDRSAVRRAIQSRIGYLPENCPVWPEMSVVDYLDYQAALHQVPVDKRPAAIARAIARARLQEKALATIGTLSRGYRQRVGVAQAILHSPAIIILDEPTNGLDPQQIREMRKLIGELAQESTVIVSSHILQEVQAVCERVLIMNRGKLVLDARLDALQQGRRLLVSVAGDASAVLGAVPGVSGVTPAGRQGVIERYAVDAPADAAPAIAQAVINAGLRLHGLQPERSDLETVFAQVTTGGGNAVAAEEAAHVA